jgi:hypothetical protein
VGSKIEKREAEPKSELVGYGSRLTGRVFAYSIGKKKAGPRIRALSIRFNAVV